MGKRKKSARKAPTKKKQAGLPTSFACLFCNHDNSVTVELQKKHGIGTLSCKVCGQSFQTGINYLSAAVDVYSDWVDACDAVARDTADSSGTRKANRDINTSQRRHTAVEDGLEEDDYDDEGMGLSRGRKSAGAGRDSFIVDDDADAEGEYADDD